MACSRGCVGLGVSGGATRRVAAACECRRLSAIDVAEQFLLHPDRAARHTPSWWRHCFERRSDVGSEESIERSRSRTAEAVRPLLPLNGCALHFFVSLMVFVLINFHLR